MYISYFYYRFLIFNSVRSTVNLHWSSDSFFLFWWLANIIFFLICSLSWILYLSCVHELAMDITLFDIVLNYAVVVPLWILNNIIVQNIFLRLFFLLPVSVFPLKTQRNNHFQNLSNSIQLAFIGNFNSFSKMSFLKAQN